MATVIGAPTPVITCLGRGQRTRIGTPGQTDLGSKRHRADIPRRQGRRRPRARGALPDAILPGDRGIDGLLNIVDYIEDNADMRSPPTILYSPRLVRRRLRKVLLGRPDLYAPFCATSIRILSRVSPNPTEIVVPVTLLTQGAEIDLRTHGHCARDMVAVLPKSPAIDQIGHNASIGCENPDDERPRPKAACGSLVEGLPASR